ncbi:MAG TPA: class I SAM-dependent methyltransferase [bacterium]|nr:class I SAM-dependent methyltransferase [bacterium]
MAAGRCTICGNQEGNRLHTAREMMFGFRDEFDYLECGNCGCLQITDVPENLSKYYPPNYYSFQDPKPRLLREPGRVRRVLRRQLTGYVLHRRRLIGRLALRIRPDWETGPEWTWLRVAGVGLNSRILDVGCGSGQLLLNLRRLGFSDLTGIDPFIGTDAVHQHVTILKRELAEVEGTFDLVMLHHSLEHMPNHADVFTELSRILDPKGCVLIRIPVSGTAAWRRYGVDWVQLDAPRHLILHSVKSLRILAAKAGFEIGKIAFDSTAFQFVGSEQYMKDIPLMDKRSYTVNPTASIFSADDIKSFEAQASILNDHADGDAATFWLRKRH